MAIVLIAVAGIASATACNTITTVQGLLTAGSCTDVFANFTLTFNNFNYAGPDSATNVNVNVDFFSGLGLAGFTFNDASGSFQTGSTTTIGYTVTVGSCNVLDTCSLIGYSDQAFIPGDGGNAGQVQITYNPVPSTGGGSPQTLTGANTNLNNTNSISAGSAIKSSVYNGLGAVGSYSDDVYGTATPNLITPEPSTLLLFGGGLLAFGAGRRRVVKR